MIVPPRSGATDKMIKVVFQENCWGSVGGFYQALCTSIADSTMSLTVKNKRDVNEEDVTSRKIRQEGHRDAGTCVAPQVHTHLEKRPRTGKSTR